MQEFIQGEDSPLAFSGLLVIVGGGALDPHLLRTLSAAGAVLVGADGGGDAIAEAGCVPRAIIGDLDSLKDPDGWGQETTVLQIAEQNTTDFEKVLYATEAPLTVALGMTGGRLDHTLAALSALARVGPGRRVILIDEHDLALCLAGPFAFTPGMGTRVSVYPLRRVRFRRSVGLLYPLDGMVLEPGGRLGTSNETSADSFAIEPESNAPWLLIVDRSHLMAMVGHLLEGGAAGQRPA